MRVFPALGTSAPSTSINWEFIRKSEGDVREPYVPVRREKGQQHFGVGQEQRANYAVIMKSGVTVGSGIDLGQQNLEDLLVKITDPGIRKSLRDKLARFFGHKRQDAVAALDQAENEAIQDLQRSQPELMSMLGVGSSDTVRSAAEIGKVFNHVTGKETPHVVLRLGMFGRPVFGLSESETSAVDLAVKQIYAERLSRLFDKKAKSHGILFGLMPPDAQTAMMSLHYHTGSYPGGKRHSAFWAAMTAGDLEEASRLFKRDVVDKADAIFVGRRKTELQLLLRSAVLQRLRKDPDWSSRA